MPQSTADDLLLEVEDLRVVLPLLAPLEVASAPYLTMDSRAIVKANVSLLSGAERELQQALKQRPNSPALRKLLDNAENRKRALRAML